MFQNNYRGATFRFKFISCIVITTSVIHYTWIFNLYTWVYDAIVTFPRAATSVAQDVGQRRRQGRLFRHHQSGPHGGRLRVFCESQNGTRRNVTGATAEFPSARITTKEPQTTFTGRCKNRCVGSVTCAAESTARRRRRGNHGIFGETRTAVTVPRKTHGMSENFL